MVSSIGKSLAELGYQVTINHVPEIGRSYVFKISIEISGEKILVFSNNPQDDDGKVVINNYPSTVSKRIIDIIKSLI